MTLVDSISLKASQTILGQNLAFVLFLVVANKSLFPLHSSFTSADDAAVARILIISNLS